MPTVPPSSFSHTGTLCLCSQSQSPSTIFLLDDSGPGKRVAAHRCIRYLQESDMYGFFFPILHRAHSAVSVLAKPLTPARKSWMFFTELLLGFKEKPVRKMDLIPFRGADHFYALRESAGETHIPTCTWLRLAWGRHLCTVCGSTFSITGPANCQTATKSQGTALKPFCLG